MGEASRAFCYSHSSGLVATLRLLSPQHHHLGWKTLLLSSVRFNASFTETKTFDTTYTYFMAFDVFVAGT